MSSYQLDNTVDLKFTKPCKHIALNGYCENKYCKFSHSKSKLNPKICKRDGYCKNEFCWYYHPKQENLDKYIKRNFNKDEQIYYSKLPEGDKINYLPLTILNKEEIKEEEDKEIDMCLKKYFENNSVKGRDNEKTIKTIIIKEKYIREVIKIFLESKNKMIRIVC